MQKKDNYLSYDVVNKIYHMSIKDRYFSIYSILTYTIDILKEHDIAQENELKNLNHDLIQTLNLLKSSRTTYPAKITISYKNGWVIDPEFKKS